MAANAGSLAESSACYRTLLIGVLGIALAARIAHVSAALASPLSYQPGPDEDYYLQFAQAVAAGRGYESPILTFMDPGYGYLLGAIVRIFGPSLFVIYLLQAVLDTTTVYGIFAIGVHLQRPRAGLYGALLYALSSTAIMFSATLLKETWVASFVTWWVVLSLVVLQSKRRFPWLAFGVYCGLGVVLRSTLMGLGLLALVLPFWAAMSPARSAQARAGLAALWAAGFFFALVPWALRNHAADGSLSPLPHNGGIVLHQIYNEQNASASIWVPDFVDYLHPGEIWRGYAAEAGRRTASALSPSQVDAYWRNVALDYIEMHPAAVSSAIAHKAVAFLSAAEVPNNRSSPEERMFSPVLRLLPSPVPWLLGMGLAGLLALALTDRRWPLLAAPILLAWAAFAIFWAEDRFRFHAMGILAFCAGYWVERIAVAVSAHRRSTPIALGAMAAALAALSLYLGSLLPSPEVRWDHIVWGYIKMNKIREAQTVARRLLHDQPGNTAMLEALGFVAAGSGRYDDAKVYLTQATALRPRSHVAHFNLARVLLALGDRANAEREAETALMLHASPDYEALHAQIMQSDSGTTGVNRP